MLRWTGRLLIALLLLLALGGAGGFSYLRLSLPQTEGERGLAGLDAAVEIIRDARGVPTIRAETMADAYRALGFLHAQDRLWQMETARRFGRGTLSEVVGRSALRFDRFARALDLEGVTRRQMQGLPAEVKAALDAYAAGVNAYLDAPDGPPPPEFLLTRITPAPWTPVDSLLWGKLMALQLSGDWRAEQAKSTLLQRLPPERVADLTPSYADSPTTLTAEEVAAAGPALKHLAARPFPPEGLTSQSASNAWVVAGSRTATGAPMLANDPHLRLGLPATWYLARIETPELTLTGATAPGVPFHIIGHNGAAAWGLTTTHADSMDLIALAPDPAAPDQRYLTDAGSRVYQSEAVEIPLGGGESERFERRWTQFGPVLPDEGPPVALQWSALRDRDATPEALFRLNRATSVEAFQAAARLFDAPVQNLFWANGSHIASAIVGRLPVRAAGRSGALPRISTAADAAWLGVTDPAATPIAVDPADGLIANANNRIMPDAAAPYPIARDWQPPHRYQRVRDLLEGADRPHDAALSAAVQTDVVSVFARELTPHLLRAQPATERGRRALARLAAWDHAMSVDAAGPAIFSAAADELARVLAEDDLGPAFTDWWTAEPGFLQTALTDKPAWCDDLRTPVEEDCLWALSTAIDRATAQLADRLGEDVAAWRWGDLHIAPMGHTPLTYIPVVKWLSDRPLETPGGDHTPNRGQTGGPASGDSFAHRHGAGMRVIYDLADLDRSEFALAGGQSGHFLSPHYADSLMDWRDGRYFRIPGRSGDIEEGDKSRLILQPE